LLAVLLLAGPVSAKAPRLRVGSKSFTESHILAELVRLLAIDAGADAEHIERMGDTSKTWNGLTTGALDVYPEYTGTLLKEIFAGKKLAPGQLRAELDRHGIAMSRSLGFSNNYALGMKEAKAERLEITKVSELADHPELQLGVSHAFLERGDGWRGLKAKYGLKFQTPQGMEHSLAYKALDGGTVDVIDVYTTDAEIGRYDVRVLEDDRNFFPPYDAVLLYRKDLEERAPALVRAIRRLEGKIDNTAMQHMNDRAIFDKVPEVRVAADYLQDELDIGVQVEIETMWGRLWRMTLQHLLLVLGSLVPAILVAVPLGVVAARRPLLGQIILGLVSVVQTFPALALLTVLIVVLRQVGTAPALVALFVYSLLPIVRNTVTGLQDVPLSVRESAEALGLSWWDQLTLVEMPMASRSILAGIKTAAVINVGFATLGGLVGAGGYGQAIMAGLDKSDTQLLLLGAVPAVLMALAVQGLFDLSEPFVVPKGLRLTPTE
jgi:osmoprotectant transport system permease protein